MDSFAMLLASKFGRATLCVSMIKYYEWEVRCDCLSRALLVLEQHIHIPDHMLPEIAQNLTDSHISAISHPPDARVTRGVMTR